MIKRLLNCSPREMLNLSPQELFTAIKISEGRVIMAPARLRGPNLIQYVSCAEVAAAFGADIVKMNCYNPDDPIFPGLPSKDPKDDEPYRKIQVQLGKGWTLREVRQLIGRPVMVGLSLEPDAFGAKTMDTGFIDTDTKESGGMPHFTEERLEKILEQKADIIEICVHGVSQPGRIAAIRHAKEIIGNRALLESGVNHGPGLIAATEEPFNLRELITPEDAAEMVKAGAQIIQFPATGSLPGFTPEYAALIVDAIHKAGGIANAGIHSSQEGADEDTVRRIAIGNKTIGADMITLGDAGLNENMPIPEVIMAACIAVKGKRHTYRRMSESVLR